MSLKLPRMNNHVPLVDDKGVPTNAFTQWWQMVATAFDSLSGIVAKVQAAQAAATTAQAAAVTAQTAADAAQATADAIVVPPTGSQTISSNITLTGASASVLVNASGGPVTVTLPVAATIEHNIIVKKTDASANVVAITPHSGDTINGAGFLNLTTQFQTATVVSDGATNWYG